jgi:hypothetical protein
VPSHLAFSVRSRHSKNDVFPQEVLEADSPGSIQQSTLRPGRDPQDGEGIARCLAAGPNAAT